MCQSRTQLMTLNDMREEINKPVYWSFPSSIITIHGRMESLSEFGPWMRPYSWSPVVVIRAFYSMHQITVSRPYGGISAIQNLRADGHLKWLILGTVSKIEGALSMSRWNIRGRRYKINKEMEIKIVDEEIAKEREKEVKEVNWKAPSTACSKVLKSSDVNHSFFIPPPFQQDPKEATFAV